LLKFKELKDEVNIGVVETGIVVYVYILPPGPYCLYVRSYYWPAYT